jgi:ABC-type antimicrobial peptide transport system permease subunit
MSQNLEEMSQDYIFPTGKEAPTNIFPIDLGLKEPRLRSFSSNLTENNEHVYEDIIDDYDTPIATQSNKYENLAVRQSQVEHDNNNVASNMDFVYYNDTTDKSKTANKNEQIKSSFFGNRKKLIIFSSILFVIAVVAIIAVIMIVLATASK